MSASFLVLPDETAPKLLYETAPGEETEQPPLPSLRDTFPPRGRQGWSRVRNGFCVLYKIPRLTLGMTKMSFIFRDPSVRAALPRLLRMTKWWRPSPRDRRLTGERKRRSPL